ncbi:phage recombination protein Bet [Caldicellulosiruptor saccharolyticus DSM 8903]|uniref:Phage recombination protein Bet n=1 Tax=Caldicellulosiruptor saccharolyticus (strain ATCC 43494 / DSM 8903 / Tp8T 6331) TaxID=351627 RepID=A4XMN9_CALS8|nr:phage recombination protein Bet [Caldicellulosiruptor saccharolyticus]ABP68174.1 phage recombination protein Bet [Caldicellulosiruptor saccharolyticus DSM 8903]
MEKSIIKRNDIPEVVYTSEDGKEIRLTFDLVKRYLVSGDATKVSDEEVVLFMKLCEAQKLNPFRKDVYLIKFNDEPASLVVSKDVFIRRAQKSGLCNGWRAGIVVRHDNGSIEFREGTLTLENETLIGGWAEVFRKDWQVPLKITVSLSEYLRRRKDGQPMRSWQQMPATMIRKVALEQALREAFMEELQGLYGIEEMSDPQEVENKPAIVVQPEEVEQAEDQKVQEKMKNQEEVQALQKVVRPVEESKQSTPEVQPAEKFQGDEYQLFFIREVNIIRAKNGKDYFKLTAYTEDAEKKILYAEANEKMQFEKNMTIKAKIQKENNLILDYKVENAA